jgi:hypothetical protein
MQDQQLHPESARRDLQFSSFCVVESDALRIDENSDRPCGGNQFVQHFETLAYQRGKRNGEAREIAAGPVEAGDDASLNRIDADLKNDWN